MPLEHCTIICEGQDIRCERWRLQENRKMLQFFIEPEKFDQIHPRQTPFTAVGYREDTEVIWDLELFRGKRPGWELSLKVNCSRIECQSQMMKALQVGRIGRDLRIFSFCEVHESLMHLYEWEDGSEPNRA